MRALISNELFAVGGGLIESDQDEDSLPHHMPLEYFNEWADSQLYNTWEPNLDFYWTFNDSPMTSGFGWCNGGNEYFISVMDMSLSGLSMLSRSGVGIPGRIVTNSGAGGGGSGSLWDLEGWAGW